MEQLYNPRVPFRIIQFHLSNLSRRLWEGIALLSASALGPGYVMTKKILEGNTATISFLY